MQQTATRFNTGFLQLQRRTDPAKLGEEVCLRASGRIMRVKKRIDSRHGGAKAQLVVLDRNQVVRIVDAPQQPRPGRIGRWLKEAVTTWERKFALSVLVSVGGWVPGGMGVTHYKPLTDGFLQLVWGGENGVAV